MKERKSSILNHFELLCLDPLRLLLLLLLIIIFSRSAEGFAIEEIEKKERGKMQLNCHRYKIRLIAFCFVTAFLDWGKGGREREREKMGDSELRNMFMMLSFSLFLFMFCFKMRMSFVCFYPLLRYFGIWNMIRRKLMAFAARSLLHSTLSTTGRLV